MDEPTQGPYKLKTESLKMTFFMGENDMPCIIVTFEMEILTHNI
jgi:hypothetical protein